MSEEILDIERDQSLEDSAAALRAVAGLLETAGDKLTIAYADESATLPAPDGVAEFELELEREPGEETDEVELELELEWEVPAEEEDEQVEDSEDDEAEAESEDDESDEQ